MRKRMRNRSSLGGILPSDCRWEIEKWGLETGSGFPQESYSHKGPNTPGHLGSHGWCVGTAGRGLTAQEPLVPAKPGSRSHIFGAKARTDDQNMPAELINQINCAGLRFKNSGFQTVGHVFFIFHFHCCLFLGLADMLTSILTSVPLVVLLLPNFWFPKSLVFQLDSLPLWFCTAVCCLKVVRPDSHLHSGSTKLHTHLRVLFFFLNVGRRTWMQEGAIPIIAWGCYTIPLV